MIKKCIAKRAKVGYNNLFLQTVSLSFLFCDMIWLNYGFMVDKVNRKKIETM